MGILKAGNTDEKISITPKKTVLGKLLGALNIEKKIKIQNQKSENQKAIIDFCENDKGVILTFLNRNNPINGILRTISSKVIKSVGESTINVSDEKKIFEFLTKNAELLNRPILFLIEHIVNTKNGEFNGIGLIDKIRKIKLVDKDGNSVNTKINIIYVKPELDDIEINSLKEIGVDKILITPISLDKFIESLGFALKPELTKDFDDTKLKVARSLKDSKYEEAKRFCSFLIEQKPDTSIARMFLGDIYFKMMLNCKEKDFLHSRDDLIGVGIWEKLFERISKLKDRLKDKSLKDFLIKIGYKEENLAEIKDFRPMYIFKIFDRLGYSNKLLEFLKFTDKDYQKIEKYYFNMAEIYYKEAVKLNPEFIDTLKKLEIFYKKTNSKQKYLGLMKKLRKKSPLILNRNTFYIKLLLEVGDLEEATKILNFTITKVLKRYNINFTYKYLSSMSKHFFQFGDKIDDKEKRKNFLEQGVYFLEQGINNVGEKNDLKIFRDFVSLGINCRKIGRSIDAVDWYKKALKIDPSNLNLYINIGLTYFYANNAREASKWIDDAYKLSQDIKKDMIGDNFELAYYIACIYYKLNRKEEALMFLKKSLDSKPDYDKSIKLQDELLTE